jgi:hypothetical protein
MTATFKIQRIRSCTQCHELLPLKCEKCVCSPKREPRVVELFGWPEVLQVGPCGCFQIACQAAGCVRKMWRYPGKNPKGLSVSRNLYCSKQCTLREARAARTTAVMLPCRYCRKLCRRKQSDLARHANVFCHPEHYFLFRSKQKHQEKRAAAAAVEATDRGLLECLKCKDITEHLTPAKTYAVCLICGTKRSQSVTATNISETKSVKLEATR